MLVPKGQEVVRYFSKIVFGRLGKKDIHFQAIGPILFVRIRGRQNHNAAWPQAGDFFPAGTSNLFNHGVLGQKAILRERMSCD
jgi:hypothetical protein